MFTVNDMDLDFDIFDAETVKLYEEAYGVINETFSQIESSKKLSELYAVACPAVKRVFDDIFGPGTGDQVCGEQDNFKVCVEAFEALTDEVVKQRAELDEMAKSIQKKYSTANRAQRRAK